MNYNVKSRSLSDDEIVGMYFRDISREGLLTEKEERYLAIRTADGDEKARETLVKANLRFVIKIAKEYQGLGMPLSELISEGNVGLLTAVDKYDVNQGTRFVSYAIWWIRQSILKALSEKARMVRLPQNRLIDLGRIKNEAHNFEEEYGRTPTDDELSSRVNLSKDVLKNIRFATMSSVSLDAPLKNNNEEDSKTFIKDVVASEDSNFTDEMEEREKKEDVLRLINKLPQKEASVIKMRFGLGDYGEMSLSDIGEIMSLTKERIRQIEKIALTHLKETMEEEKKEEEEV